MSKAQKLACTILIAGVALWVLMDADETLRFNARNRVVADEVRVALGAYASKNGRYPPTIDALTPEFLRRPLPLVPGTSLYYAASPSGDHYWLALVPWKRYVVPGDRALELESGKGREGVVRDVSELTAKDVGIRRQLPKS